MCNCGKRAFTTREIKPKRISSLMELREKIIGPKQDSTITKEIKPQTLQPVAIFKAITEKINPLLYKTNDKTIILIERTGSAECKYLKNMLSKFTIIENYQKSINFLSIEISYLVNQQDFSKLPTTLFLFKNNTYKSISGLFDVKAILRDFNILG